MLASIGPHFRTQQKKKKSLVVFPVVSNYMSFVQILFLVHLINSWRLNSFLVLEEATLKGSAEGNHPKFKESRDENRKYVLFRLSKRNKIKLINHDIIRSPLC